MARVRMRVPVAGARNGEDWPGVGQILECGQDEANSLLQAGLAEPLGTVDEDQTGPVIDERTGRAYDPERIEEGRHPAEAFGQFPDGYVPGDDTGATADQRLEPVPAAPVETVLDQSGPMPPTPETPLVRPSPEDTETGLVLSPDVSAEDLRHISPVSKSHPGAGGAQALPGGADPVTDRPNAEGGERNDVTPQGPPGTGGGSVADPGESERRPGARAKAARRGRATEEQPPAEGEPPAEQPPASPTPGPRG